jgi:hypothetical protein
MKREWTDLEFADWTLLPSEAALLANKGVWLVFRGITQRTVDVDEAVDLDPPDADHENDDDENGRHPRPPDFSNN